MNEEKHFQGVIDEIPFISVDYFHDIQNISGFFLSHCHADHMKGLDSLALFQTLQEVPGILIYCSNVTKEILENWPTYSRLGPFLKALEVNQTNILNFPNSCDEHSSATNLCVTLIPSGHCPGSVMFLYEGAFGTVLYTGDFRIAKRDMSKFQALMVNPSRPQYGLKPIDHIYLDCTFCCMMGKSFPSRETSVDTTISLIKNWLNEGSEHRILFSLAGRGFGAEFIFVEVYQKLKMQTHISKFKYDVYKNIPGIRSAVCRDPSSRIHACADNCLGLSKRYPPCLKDSHKILTIRLTTQWHIIKEEENVETRIVVNDNGMCRILFSMHSSLEEIQDVVSSLVPRKVTPIAKPDKVSHDEIAQLLNCEVAVPQTRTYIFNCNTPTKL